jgi:hypothetical protein
MKYIVLVLILDSFNINGEAQKSDKLISMLEEKLFHSSEQLVLFAEYIKAYDEACGYIKYDTSLQIRATQPNPDTVSSILYQLMMKNDTSDFQPILALYQRQIEYFKVEWGPIYLANFYACEIVDQQYRILCEFENVLTSLSLKKYTNSELASKYKEDKLLSEHFYYNFELREELKSKYSHFSDYFKKLRDKAWFGSRASFSQYEPYFNGIKTFILDDFYSFHYQPNNTTNQYKYFSNYIHSTVKNLIINRYYNDTVGNNVISNFEMWLSNDRGFIHDLIERGHIKDESLKYQYLSNFYEDLDFVKRCFGGSLERCQSDWIYRLNQSEIWRSPAKKMLKDDAKSNSTRKLNSINLLQHFPEDDVVSFLVSLDDDHQLNEQAKEVLYQTLKELAKNKEISRESKTLIQNKIKIIKVGNCPEVNLAKFKDYTISDIEFKEAYLLMSCIYDYAIKGDTSAYHALFEISNIVAENVSKFDFFNSANVLMKYARDTKCSNDPKRNFPAYEHFGLKVCWIIINNLSDKKYSNELSQFLSIITQQEILNSDTSEDGCTYRTQIHKIFMERLEKDYRDGKLNFE